MPLRTFRAINGRVGTRREAGLVISAILRYSARLDSEETAMHYPRRQSNIKRRRKFGFRARMKTTLGRKMINRKRRMGRRLSALNK